jgi:hypothetical protein
MGVQSGNMNKKTERRFGKHDRSRNNIAIITSTKLADIQKGITPPWS